MPLFRYFRFRLRTLLFWVVPYVGVCAWIASCRGLDYRPGGEGATFGINAVAIAWVTCFWIALFVENRNARERIAKERQFPPSVNEH